jgi:probable F420-dependent oxidoreductase
MFDGHHTMAHMFDSDLTSARAALRERLTPYGLWIGGPRLTSDAAELADLAAEIDESPFGALWLGGSPGADLPRVRELLGGASSLLVATSIVNIWVTAPAAVAGPAAAVRAEFGDRFVLGVGAGHRAAVERDTGQAYEKPYSKLVAYLDELDETSPAVPPSWRAVAALGPRTVALAGERTLGALPYLTAPSHSAEARSILGAEPVLVVEQGVVLESDPAVAREVAREALTYYFDLPNYTNSWLRQGFTQEDIAAPGTDRLIDAIVAWGSPEVVAGRLREHLDAGADQVAVQPLGAGKVSHDVWRRLAPAL